MRTISVWVAGTPIAQGSIKAVGSTPSGHAILTSTAKGLKPWRTQIGWALQQQVTELTAGPVSVGLLFLLPRPKSLPKTREIPHVKRPDIDKILRAVLDAMSNVVYHDDSQVNKILVEKRYALVSEQPGVCIRLELED